jgi:hypothetical protein
MPAMASPQVATLIQLMTPDATVIYPSRWKMLLVAAVSAIFVVFGLALFLFKPAGATEHIVVLTCTVVTTLPLLYSIARLVRPSPALVIHSSGIFDNASTLSAGFLRWEEISGVGIATLKGQRSLAIAVKDVDALLGRQPAFKAKIMKINIGILGAAVNIPNTLPISLEELMQTIQQRCPAIQVMS